MLHVVLEELDETVLWLEMLVDGEVVARSRMSGLRQEANELLAIFGASSRAAKTRSTAGRHVGP